MRLKALLFSVPLTLVGCPDYDDHVAPHGAPGNDGATVTEPDSETVSGDQTTWWKHVKPIVAKNCLSCHVAGGIGTMSLETYEATTDWQHAMVARVNDDDPRDRMPPWPMDPSCREVQDARLLTAEEKQTFKDWQADGFLEGDPSTYVAPEIEKVDLGTPDIELTRPKYQLPALPNGVIDHYRCFLLDREVQDETWVEAVDIVPDVKAVVHHVLVFVIPPGEVTKIAAKQSSASSGYDCLGGSGAKDDALLAGWVPGMLPVQFPAKAAFRVPKGSRFVIQMHYNIDNVDPPLPADATGANLWTVGRQGLTHEVRMRWILDPALDIGPGENPAIESVTVRSPFTETVIGVIPHMHLLGETIDVTTRPVGGTTDKCLVKIPKWDFHWQQTYQYADDDQVKVRIGDEVKITCGYDNSDGTSTVTWGENTSDEMCLNYLVTTTPMYDDDRDTTCNGFERCMKDCQEGDALCPFDCMAWSDGGAACIQCALTPVYAQCPAAAGGGCLALLQSFGACYNGCVDRVGADATILDKVTCGVADCRTQLDALYGGCLEKLIRDGECDDEAAACGIGPPAE